MNMDYEQNYKQKYEGAIERMRSWVRGEHPECFSEAQKAAEFIFPELKESEGEKIRKAIIRIFKGETGYTTREVADKYVAWLEKQKEPEDKGEISDGYHTFNELYRYRMLYNAAFFNLLPKHMVHKSKRHHDGEECFGGGWFIVMANLPTGQISNHYELKHWDLFQIPEKDVADEWDGHTPQEAADRLHKYLLEKRVEQKPDDNKPKFKVGDWVVWDNEVYCHIENIYQDKESLMYTVTNTSSMARSFSVKDFDNNAHLWTILDAKDGDVLASECCKSIIIFKGIDDDNNIQYYCGYDFLETYPYPYYARSRFSVSGGCQHFGNVGDSADIHPATKEQYDTIMTAMRKAGYKLDSGRKELKKIESRVLNSDKVIEWLKPFDCMVDNLTDKFKHDFGL